MAMQSFGSRVLFCRMRDNLDSRFYRSGEKKEVGKCFWQIGAFGIFRRGKKQIKSTAIHGGLLVGNHTSPAWSSPPSPDVAAITIGDAARPLERLWLKHDAKKAVGGVRPIRIFFQISNLNVLKLGYVGLVIQPIISNICGLNGGFR